MRHLAIIFLLGWTSGCAVVPAYQREHLADPTMAVSSDPLEQQSIRKLHTAREAAGGGGGVSAGGGCACSN
ncbi:MAG: DUF4266 domain-containing protein [Myxococcota bacterium]